MKSRAHDRYLKTECSDEKNTSLCQSVLKRRSAFSWIAAKGYRCGILNIGIICGHGMHGFDGRSEELRPFSLQSVQTNMSIKPTVALRAIVVGGIAAFAKIGGAVKAAGGVKLGAAAAAMTAAATAAVSGSKQEEKDGSQQLSSK
ncbi:hypothetical protein HAX54_043325 [Datura stramonium]|uniref:Uncharacterized protein n=1 Tax=Datura stramonium TaxID=4076 RepID=A0ABS8W340_DATST|nr:hypothetical protein [Datura stramonium]